MSIPHASRLNVFRLVRLPIADKSRCFGLSIFNDVRLVSTAISSTLEACVPRISSFVSPVSPFNGDRSEKVPSGTCPSL